MASIIYANTIRTSLKHELISLIVNTLVTVVPLVSNKRIVVCSWNLTSLLANTFAWGTGVVPTALTGIYSIAANAQVGVGWHPDGVFATAKGEALTIQFSVATTVGGSLTYFETD